jgi:hypothetical protein
MESKWTVYDYWSGKQLKYACKKRGLPINQHQIKHKYRVLLVQDDLKNKKDPYVSPSHNSSSPSSAHNPSPQ